RFGVAAVEHDEPGAGLDQIGGVVRRAHVIEPFADAERRVRRVGGLLRPRPRRENGRHEGGRSEERRGGAAHRGARLMIIWRPSIRGSYSTLATGSKSDFTCCSSLMPSSGWASSRPRKRRVIFTLSPSSKNRCIDLALTS